MCATHNEAFSSQFYTFMLYTNRFFDFILCTGQYFKSYNTGIRGREWNRGQKKTSQRHAGENTPRSRIIDHREGVSQYQP
jgi:hypothetical protein